MEKQKERAVEILKLLKTEGFLGINDLAARMTVSSMTIRRDLQQLDKEGLIKLLPGGAILNGGSGSVGEAPYSLIAESCLQPEAKQRIGRKAAELLEPDDLIIIDSGTTTEYLARSLPDDMPLTILTYTLNILFEVYKKKRCKIIFPGGYYHDNTMMFESPEGIELIERTRAQKAFIGATGFSDRLGITCSNPTEPNVKRAVLQSSLCKILVVDSSKFDVVRSCYFAEIADFDIIITDDGIPKDYYDLCTKLGKKVIIA